MITCCRTAPGGWLRARRAVKSSRLQQPGADNDAMGGARLIGRPGHTARPISHRPFFHHRAQHLAVLPCGIASAGVG